MLNTGSSVGFVRLGEEDEGPRSRDAAAVKKALANDLHEHHHSHNTEKVPYLSLFLHDAH